MCLSSDMSHHIFAYINKLHFLIYLHICKYVFILYCLISLYVHKQIYISAIWINYPSLHICTHLYKCKYAFNMYDPSYICIYDEITLPIYLHICKYPFSMYVSILHLHIGINYFALHICIYHICSNMSLWHIHLYHIFAYFNKLTPEGEGSAGLGAHHSRFGGRVLGLTPSSRRPILSGVRRRGLEKGLRDSALLSSLIPSWDLEEGGVDKFSC